MTRAALASVLLVAAFSAGARAHDITPDALIAKGLDLRRAGRSIEALEFFRRAHREAPSPRTLGQMGLVEASLAHWTDADTHLAAALTTPDDFWVRQNRPFLEQALDRARTHIGELVVVGRPGTTVSFAGKALGVLPLAGPVRAVEGDFGLTASAATFKPFSTSVSIKGGTRSAMTIVLEPRDIAAPPPLAADSFSVVEPSRSSARKWSGVALGVVGLAAVTWGTSWIELDNHNSCGSPQFGSCGTVYDTRTSGWILTAGGIALALAGGAMLLSTLHAPKSDLAFGITPRSLLLQARF
jgi:hypothetical protein